MLTPKNLHYLKVSLAEKYKKADAAERIAENAFINTDGIDFTGNRLEFWDKIIQKALSDNKLIPLLEKVQAEHPDDNKLVIWLDQLKNRQTQSQQRLADMIRQRECLLFLGPGLLQTKLIDNLNGSIRTTSFNEALSRGIAKMFVDSNTYYASSQASNLAYMAQRYNEEMGLIPGIGGKLVNHFYSNCTLENPDPDNIPLFQPYNSCEIDNSLYELVARLPFRTIINTNFDNELEQLINAQKTSTQQPGKCDFRYYNMANPNGESQQQPSPVAENDILLYNIFGWFNDRPSVILTESQVLAFTNSVITKTPPIDPAVVQQFTVDLTIPRSYLFLGFDFDHWCAKVLFQIILKLIKQENRAFSIMPKGLGLASAISNEANPNREFFEEEFKCYFIDDNLETFLKKLITLV